MVEHSNDDFEALRSFRPENTQLLQDEIGRYDEIESINQEKAEEIIRQLRTHVVKGDTSKEEVDMMSPKDVIRTYYNMPNPVSSVDGIGDRYDEEQRNI